MLTMLKITFIDSGLLMHTCSLQMIIQTFIGTFCKFLFYLAGWEGTGRNTTLNFNKSDFETKVQIKQRHIKIPFRRVKGMILET